LGNKVDTQTFRVSCVCGTAGLAKRIGLGKVGQREKDLRVVIHLPLINPNGVLLPPFHIKV